MVVLYFLLMFMNRWLYRKYTVGKEEFKKKRVKSKHIKVGIISIVRIYRISVTNFVSAYELMEVIMRKGLKKLNMKKNLCKIIVSMVLAASLILGSFVFVKPQAVQAKTYNAAGEWTMVDGDGSNWVLTISMFTSPDSGNLVGNYTFTCGMLLGTRLYSPFYVNGDVYKISSNKYKCKSDNASFTIKLTSNKKLKLIKNKSTKNITGELNPNGKYKLTKRYRS